MRKRRRFEESIGTAPRCPECGGGHIHLEKHGTNAVSRWQWTCTTCSDFCENIQEPCGACGVPAAPPEPSDYILMRAIPAAASNALQPLVHQQMFVGEEEVDLDTLRAEAQRRSNDWSDSFSILPAVERGSISEQDAGRLSESCLRDAYLVDRIRVVTTTYGYTAEESLVIHKRPSSPVTVWRDSFLISKDSLDSWPTVCRLKVLP
jgi:hypothetical protein